MSNAFSSKLFCFVLFCDLVIQTGLEEENNKAKHQHVAKSSGKKNQKRQLWGLNAELRKHSGEDWKTYCTYMRSSLLLAQTSFATLSNWGLSRAYHIRFSIVYS